MAEYEKKVRQILSKNGCTFRRRGKGDHDIWYSPIKGGYLWPQQRNYRQARTDA